MSSTISTASLRRILFLIIAIGVVGMGLALYNPLQFALSGVIGGLVTILAFVILTNDSYFKIIQKRW